MLMKRNSVESWAIYLYETRIVKTQPLKREPFVGFMGEIAAGHRRIVACKWYDKWKGWRFYKRAVSYENCLQFSYIEERERGGEREKKKLRKEAYVDKIIARIVVLTTIHYNNISFFPTSSILRLPNGNFMV